MQFFPRAITRPLAAGAFALTAALAFGPASPANAADIITQVPMITLGPSGAAVTTSTVAPQATTTTVRPATTTSTAAPAQNVLGSVQTIPLAPKTADDATATPAADSAKPAVSDSLATTGAETRRLVGFAMVLTAIGIALLAFTNSFGRAERFVRSLVPSSLRK